MKYILRGISFIAKKGVWILITIGIFVTIFTSAMNLSNMFILVSDGLEMRAATILGSNSGAELGKYFSEGFIDEDPMLYESPYAQYRISGASYTASFEWLWAWPWQTTTTAVVTERVVLEGEKRKEYYTDAEKKALESIDADAALDQGQKQKMKKQVLAAPYWQNGRYEVSLRKLSNGSWMILRINKTEELPNATLRPNQ